MAIQPDIQLERLYPHPPALVWRGLTEADLIAQWLVRNDFEPVVGHRFRLDALTPGERSGFHGDVTVVDEPRQLAYVLTAPFLRHPTTMTWTLTPENDDTLLRLEHAGFSGMNDTMVSAVLRVAWQKLMMRLSLTLDELSRTA